MSRHRPQSSEVYPHPSSEVKEAVILSCEASLILGSLLAGALL